MSDKVLGQIVLLNQQILRNQEIASQERHSHSQKLQEMDGKVDSVCRIVKGEPEAPEMGLLARVRGLETFNRWALRILTFGMVGGGGTATAMLTGAKEAASSVPLPGITH